MHYNNSLWKSFFSCVHYTSQQYLNLNNIYVCVQSCPIVCSPMDCGSPGSSVHGIFLARILEWVAIPYSWGSSWPWDGTRISCISCIGQWILYHHHHQIPECVCTCTFMHLVAKSFLTLSQPHGLRHGQAPLSMGFFSQEYMYIL